MSINTNNFTRSVVTSPSLATPPPAPSSIAPKITQTARANLPQRDTPRTSSLNWKCVILPFVGLTTALFGAAVLGSGSLVSPLAERGYCDAAFNLSRFSSRPSALSFDVLNKCPDLPVKNHLDVCERSLYDSNYTQNPLFTLTLERFASDAKLGKQTCAKVHELIQGQPDYMRQPLAETCFKAAKECRDLEVEKRADFVKWGSGNGEDFPFYDNFEHFPDFVDTLIDEDRVQDALKVVSKGKFEPEKKQQLINKLHAVRVDATEFSDETELSVYDPVVEFYAAGVEKINEMIENFMDWYYS